MKVSKEELAALINNREYRDEITPEQEQIAKDNGLVVIFGASDDFIKFRGFLDDELGDDIFYIKDNSIRTPSCVLSQGGYDRFFNKELFPDKNTKENNFHKIVPVWEQIIDGIVICPWSFKTHIPHASFDIYEDGNLFCKGIVIDVNQLRDLTNLQSYLIKNKSGLHSLHVALYANRMCNWKNKMFASLELEKLDPEHKIILSYPGADTMSMITDSIKLNYPEWWEEIKHNPVGDVINMVNQTIYKDNRLLHD